MKRELRAPEPPRPPPPPRRTLPSPGEGPPQPVSGPGEEARAVRVRVFRGAARTGRAGLERSRAAPKVQRGVYRVQPKGPNASRSISDVTFPPPRAEPAAGWSRSPRRRRRLSRQPWRGKSPFSREVRRPLLAPALWLRRRPSPPTPPIAAPRRRIPSSSPARLLSKAAERRETDVPVGA